MLEDQPMVDVMRFDDDVVYWDLLREDVQRAIQRRRLVATIVHFLLGVAAFLVPPWLSFAGPVFDWWTTREPMLKGGEVTAIVGVVFLVVWLIVAVLYVGVVVGLRRSADAIAREAIASLRGGVGLAATPVAAPGIGAAAAVAERVPKKRPGGRGDDPRAWPAPPRTVPRRVVLAIVGEEVLPFAFAALAATLFAWICDWHTMVAHTLYTLQPTQEVPGVIVQSQRFELSRGRSNAWEQQVPVRHEAHARDDATIVAEGWSSEGRVAKDVRGRPVTLHVPAWFDRPGAWIDGMRLQRADPRQQALFITFYGLGAWVFAVLAAIGAKRALRAVHLLRHGEIAFATLQRRKVQHRKNEKYLRCTFGFTLADGTTHTVDADVHGDEDEHPLLDELEEPLVVDPKAPNEARLLGTLAGNPRVAPETGRWETRGGGAYVGLFVIGVFVIVNVALLAWPLLQ
jgi:VCBS repeat-containing protein